MAVHNLRQESFLRSPAPYVVFGDSDRCRLGDHILTSIPRKEESKRKEALNALDSVVLSCHHFGDVHRSLQPFIWEIHRLQLYGFGKTPLSPKALHTYLILSC